MIEIGTLWHYGMVVVLMMTGLYIVIAKRNYVKKMMGLSIFQVSVIMLYVSMGKIAGGTPPIYLLEADGSLTEGVVYSNPLPMVLMLTAIVVGVATTSVGLAGTSTTSCAASCAACNSVSACSAKMLDSSK